MQTIRQRIIALLSEAERTARDLSPLVGIREKDVYEHLAHIERSVVSQGKRLVIVPSRCLECGYVFKERKRFTNPGRCPRCKGEHIQEPRYQVI